MATEKEARMRMLKEFDETNAGVKGLVDSGLQKIPEIFVSPPDELAREPGPRQSVEVPVIDVGDMGNPERRNGIVEQVRMASEAFGFFQVVNHGIPQAVLDGMIGGVHRFMDLDVEEKRKYYTRDVSVRRAVMYTSSYDLYTARTASWRDTLSILCLGPDPIHPDELPDCSRESTIEYSKHVEILGNNLLGLLSEALGLKTNHLENMECSKGHRLHCHYYPACPQPELAIGISKHSDIGFLTILLQSQGISALQALYQGQWVDVHPTPGALVVNIGDLLQLVSNGKFKSVQHRARASCIGPRISVVCFFSGPADASKVYGPIKELISEENPPIYRDVVVGEYFSKFLSTGLDDYRGLEYYQLTGGNCEDGLA